jgi:flavodoxin I
MKALIIYDSTYGNTEKIARSVAGSLGGEEKVLRASAAKAEQLRGIDLLIVASPTLGGRPSEAVKGFLERIPAEGLKSIRVAAVDTRIAAKWVKIFGFAAEKIAAVLVKKGGTQIAPPEGFFVRRSKGPLVDKELERAAAWAKRIALQ